MLNKNSIEDYPNLKKEWNYEKNIDLDLTMFTRGSHKIVWWKCDKGHEWKEKIYLRTNGYKCPYCIGKKAIKGVNDFATIHPELLKEWNYVRNILKPNEILPNSSKKIWWKCEKGHEWEASLNNRHKGTGCPICSNELSTSFPEIAIAYYLGKCIEVECRKKVCNKEIDIYIPSINIGIEYDGIYYHNNNKSLQKDNLKTKILNENNIFLIRVKEINYNKYYRENNIIYTKTNNNYNYLKKVISDILTIINEKCNLNLKVEVDIEKDRINILENYKSIKKKNSLKIKNPMIAKEWNYEKNQTLLPEVFDVNSKYKVWWKCDKGHEWKATIYSRNGGTGCPYCSNQKVLSGFNDLATTHPEIVKEWFYEKNGEIKPSEVVAGSDKNIWWKCDKGHEWQSRIASRTNGSNCPYCANKKVLKGYNDLETWCKKNGYEYLINEFDKNKNTFSINDITYASGKKVWWICTKGHSYCTYLTHRTKMKTSCPYCSHKRLLSGFNDLATTHPEIATEWGYEKNEEIKPSNVMAGSNIRKYWFICKNGHSYLCTPLNRKKGRSCPICYKEKRYNTLNRTKE